MWTNVGTSLEASLSESESLAIAAARAPQAVFCLLTALQFHGLDVALEALKDARSQKKASADDLWRYAKICRVANVMRPYLEAVE